MTGGWKELRYWKLIQCTILESTSNTSLTMCK